MPKIRGNSLCECGCGRKFKVCNRERIEKAEKELDERLRQPLTPDQRARVNRFLAVVGAVSVHCPH